MDRVVGAPITRNMAIFVCLLFMIVGAAKLIDRRHDARLETSRSHDGFAVVDVLVISMVVSTAAAFVIMVLSTMRAF